MANCLGCIYLQMDGENVFTGMCTKPEEYNLYIPNFNEHMGWCTGKLIAETGTRGPLDEVREDVRLIPDHMDMNLCGSWVNKPQINAHPIKNLVLQLELIVNQLKDFLDEENTLEKNNPCDSCYYYGKSVVCPGYRITGDRTLCDNFINKVNKNEK